MQNILLYFVKLVKNTGIQYYFTFRIKKGYSRPIRIQSWQRTLVITMTHESYGYFSQRLGNPDLYCIDYNADNDKTQTYYKYKYARVNLLVSLQLNTFTKIPSTNVLTHR